MKKKVYISSTYKDLKDYREAIIKMFSTEGVQKFYDLKSMEGYVAKSGMRSIDVCLRDVEDADVYILILAENYGSIVTNGDARYVGKSYTENEYIRAKRVQASNEKPYDIFVFYSDVAFENVDFAARNDLQQNDLQNFFNEAKSDNAAFIYPFANQYHLCQQILECLINTFEDHQHGIDFGKNLLLLDRAEQSDFFSKHRIANNNAFYFTSIYPNSPTDFVDRLKYFDLAERYNSTDIDLTQLDGDDMEKFKDSFMALLPDELADSILPNGPDANGTFFINIHVSSFQLQVNEKKLSHLTELLTTFLPKYLAPHGVVSSSRLFCVYYSYVQPDSAQKEKFDLFISSLNAASPTIVFQKIKELNDVAKNDVKNWLGKFIKGVTFTENKLDKLLCNDDNPYKTFRMKEANTLITDWIEKNYKTN